VTIAVDALTLANARITSESTATGADAGTAGAIEIEADVVEISNSGRISATTVDGEGGSIVLHAGRIDIESGGEISAASTGSGNAGDVRVTADDELVMTNGALRTSAPISASARRLRGSSLSSRSGWAS
jgi:hypothetical protein